MKHVAPLRYDVIFKKAFSDPAIFTAFVQDVLGIKIEIDKVETEKSFAPPIGRVASRFDPSTRSGQAFFAEDTKNRVIVDIQHVRYEDHYDAFLHYHCAAILEQVAKAENYRPPLAVYSIIVLTSGDKHKVDMAMIDGSTEASSELSRTLAERLDPKTRQQQGLGEIPHKVVYLCPKDDTLDTQVEESQYQHPQIQRVFAHIEQDQVSPEERARMFEEYNQAQDKQTAIQEAKMEEKLAIARSMLAEGMTVPLIAKVTGLSEAEIRGG